jgi:hypothetical protein
VKKKLIKPIRILKKTDRFGFGFISLKLKKLNRTQAKKTEKNRAKPKKLVFVLK